jgi:predicted RNA-binding Zn-ribbon protein involved in translation (DUF1610 family)
MKIRYSIIECPKCLKRTIVFGHANKIYNAERKCDTCGELCSVSDDYSKFSSNELQEILGNILEDRNYSSLSRLPYKFLSSTEFSETDMRKALVSLISCFE